MDIHRIAIFFADNIFQVVIQLVLECVFKALTQAYNRRKKLK